MKTLYTCIQIYSFIMVKNVALSEKVIKELDSIREKEGVSYSKAIEKLMVASAEDLALNEINRRFYELESLMPEMRETWEILRVLSIHVHQMPLEVKQEHIKDINEKILRIVRHIIKLKGGKEDGKTQNR